MTDRATPSRPGWMLDEVGTAGRENLDVEHVSRYDLIEDAGAAAEVHVLRSLGLSDRSTVVELGAGTGQFSAAVARHAARVIAVDVSPPMLSTLTQKLASHGLDDVEVVEAGFLTYDHAGDPADFVYSRYALHHLPDFWKGLALSRAFDMLRPGGVLRLWDVVYNFEPAEAATRLEAWCATGGPASKADQWSRADYEEHVRDEHSTYTWVLEAMARRVGFEIESADYDADGIFAKYVMRRP